MSNVDTNSHRSVKKIAISQKLSATAGYTLSKPRSLYHADKSVVYASLPCFLSIIAILMQNVVVVVVVVFAFESCINSEA